MFKIKIAGINILLRNRYKYSECLCREYITEEEKTDFEVFASEKAISEEISNADIETDAAYAESVCLHREIAERLALPLGTVKSRIFFTRQHLQRVLKDYR